MKLGEALSIRAKQAQKLNDLAGRVRGNAVTQEGSTPAEDPSVLIDEYLNLSNEHADLVLRIQETNHSTAIRPLGPGPTGSTLADLLGERARLIRNRGLIRSAAQAASNTEGVRYMRSELKFVTTLNVASLREREQTLDAEIQKLDAEIQQINWQTDLI